MSQLAPLALLARVTLAGLVAVAATAAQRKKPKDAALKVDPYTKGAESAMKRAGYVSFGPFPFGDGHGTADIRKMMPETRLVFVETAHFKIGSSLPTFRLPKTSKRKRSLKKELKELKKILPTVKPASRVLDPWLRLHLFAYRLENHYAALQKKLGVTDADFPPKEIQLGEKHKGRFMGEGPYLGMPGKFTLLILKKASDLGRYTRKVSGKKQPLNQAHTQYFIKSGSIFLGTTTELNENHLSSDHAMHCHILYSMTLSMIMGYKGFRYRLPQWIPQGIALWFGHEFDPKEHTFRPMKEGLPDKQFDARWSRNVRGLVKNNAFRPLAELMKLQYAKDLEFLDLMTSWSRIDFLLQKHPEAFARFMHGVKDPIGPMSGKIPTFQSVLEQQARSFQRAFGYDPVAFDEAWTAFVLKTYPSR